MCKYCIIYETTNLINGKKYIGKHSTDDINDDYLGSGNLLQMAIKKYGKENFKRETIAVFEDEDQAYRYEETLVNGDIVNDENYYNLREGGYGFTSENVKKLWEDAKYREMHVKINKELWEDTEYRDMQSKKMSEQVRKQWEDPKYRDMQSKINRGENNPNAKLSEEQVRQIKIEMKNGRKNIDIAKDYGVSVSHIYEIETGRNWSHITI